MARPRNPVESVTLTITTTHKVRDCLEKLLATGTYGRNVSDAASRIVDEYVRKRFFASGDLGDLNVR